MNAALPGSLLEIERGWWGGHPGLALAGVDEAGRGCLAGPVVAGAVSIPPAAAEALYAGPLARLTDSKQLTPRLRERLFEILSAAEGVSAATGSCSPREIDRLNILAATHLAMRRAIEALPGRPAHALVDGLPVKGLPVGSTAIVKGDAKSFLIAAASVVAKVTRDRLMVRLHERWPAYGFDRNKGYPARAHLEALERFGPCPWHRLTFRPVRAASEKTLFLRRGG